MGWLTRSLSTSIGKKIIMAVTGLMLISFLFVHLVNNLLLFVSPEIFNSNVENLESIKPLIRVVEVILALIFFFHIYNAVKLWWENRKANPKKYAINANSENSSIYSRTTVWTGSIIFIFLAVHLSTFWREFNFGEHLASDPYPYYSIVADAFANPFVAGLYLIAMIILGFHLNHGFQSSFQTFGWNHNKYFPIIKILGSAAAIFYAVGFASIPIYFFVISIGGGN